MSKGGKVDKILISGTGRCGTGCVAKCLTDLGIICGHERIYSIDGIKKWNQYQADSSWLGIPYFPSFNGIKILLIREPVKCISSLVNCKLFTKNYNPYQSYMRRLGYNNPFQFYLEVNSLLFINCDYILDIDHLEGVLPNVKKWKHYNHRSGIEIKGDYIEAIDLYKKIHLHRLRTPLLEQLCPTETN